MRCDPALLRRLTTRLRGVVAPLQSVEHHYGLERLVTTSRLSSTSSSSSSSLRQQQQSHLRSGSPSSFSSLALLQDDDEEEEEDDSFRWTSDAKDTAAAAANAQPHHTKHCTTCTCDDDVHHQHPTPTTTETLPPPLPAPKYSVRRRVLPATLHPLNAPDGRRWLVETLLQDTAAPYFSLMEHFSNQSEPAYCGVSTLQMVLNALAVDPQVRWKGGWRYFGSEDVLLGQCCITPERVRRIGITMEEFAQLATCQGLRVKMKRASKQQDEEEGVDAFRQDVLECMQQQQQQDSSSGGILVVSFSRAALGQTGDGHFSPLAAYHAATDQVLVLDVARFKYQPYWVSISELYQAMMPLDTATNQPRGWYTLQPPCPSASYKGLEITSEELRPAQLVPAVGEKPLCPVHAIKVDYCKVKQRPAPAKR